MTRNTGIAPHLLGWTVLLALALSAPLPVAAQVSSFQVRVPHRTGAGQMEIAALKITLQLDTSSPVTVTVSEPASGSLTTQSMNLSTAANDCFASGCFADLPNTPGGSALPDRLFIIKPLHAGADPASSAQDKLVLILRLRSNLNEAASCTSTLTAGETWTIDVGSPRITAVSVTSLDKQTTGTGNPACGTSFRPIPLNDDSLANVIGQPAILAGGRVGVDAVLVLDRSGSMSGRVSTDPTAPTKMVRLGEAAETFIQMWQALRANECTNFEVSCDVVGSAPPIQGPTDRIGVVFFDHNIGWLQSLRPMSQISGLTNIATLNLSNEITELKAVTPGGLTSIGGGLLLAAPALAPAGSEPNRKVTLLMTDGYQNRNPLVQVSGPQVQTTNGGAPSPLPNQPPIQIYGVTVGTGAAVDPVINQNVSIASNGFYLNTEDDLAVLPNLFVQVLQNAVKYSSIETLRIIADTVRPGAPFQTTVPVTTSTYSLAFNLTWSAPRAPLRVRLTPPAGGAPIDFVGQPGRQLLTGNIAFPHEGVAQTAGDWSIQISGDSVVAPFNFTLLGDDAAVSSSLGVARAEHAVGGQIRLAAQINDLEQPLTGLGSQSGANVSVFVVRPGRSVGDVLSEAQVAVPPASGPDSASAVQRQLEAVLAENPDALDHTSDVVTLLDNGNTANGDSIADDGIYSALVVTDTEGHYNFVFHIEGTAQAGGRFVRQQLRTVHVRSLPDGDATDISTSTSTTDDGSVLTVDFTPKNVRDGNVGPGWGNYFWLAASGAAPVKPVDNGNGSYTARISFTSDSPPAVALYFLSDPVLRTDDFVPTAADLTPDDVIVQDVTDDGDAGLPWWLWLLLLLIILLVIVLIMRSRSSP
jgi:hypothetical protein